MADKNRIIIVDDDEDLLRLLATAFKSQGYEVKTIANGKDALKTLLDASELTNACLIILDRILPDMDGMDILKAFRAKFNSGTPVLVLSTLSSEKDVLEGLKSGAVDYIGKPFSLPILLQKALKLIKT